jgi:hypothetical protein
LYVGDDFSAVDGTLSTLDITATTNTTQTSTGALIVAGSVGVAKNVNIGGNTRVVGTITSEAGTSNVDKLTVN